MRKMAAGAFKTNCLAVMDEVQAKRVTVVITKHGKPVAQLVPVPEPKAKRQGIVGSMKGSVLWEGDIISPIDVEWDAMK